MWTKDLWREKKMQGPFPDLNWVSLAFSVLFFTQQISQKNKKNCQQIPYTKREKIEKPWGQIIFFHFNQGFGKEGFHHRSHNPLVEPLLPFSITSCYHYSPLQILVVQKNFKRCFHASAFVCSRALCYLGSTKMAKPIYLTRILGLHQFG